MREYPASLTRVEEVGELIEGFETPYGMELLSSTHWIAVHAVPKAESPEEAVRAIHGWSPRKRTMFRAHHITTAWNRLNEAGWLASVTAGSRY